MENPTREFLHENFTVLELRKHCRHLGLTKVWVNKDTLCDMILRSTRSMTNEHTPDNQDQPQIALLEIIRSELDFLKENMSRKDSEIDELNEMLKKAHVTINRLNDRITALEDQVGHQNVEIERPAEERTLLLGDDNLMEVRITDLDENCSIKSIKDVDFDLMKCWVNEKLDMIPTKCIIYCGLNDLRENENICSVLDSLGSLISELKDKNEEIEIFVSELAPSLNESFNSKINHFNEKLNQWSLVNGVKVMKMNLSFMLGTGEIDEMCFESENEKAGMILNRYGALRLLSVIHKQCNCLKAKENIEAGGSYIHPRNFSAMDRNIFSRRRPPINRLELQNFEQRKMRPKNYHYGRQEYPEPQTFGSQYYKRTSPSSITRTNDWRQKGCFNCGEYNHRQANCRYDHRIRCNYCFKFGHKNKMCTTQNI